MYCDIAKNLDDEKLQGIQALEEGLGLTIVAFVCRSLDPAREERLRTLMEEFGPQLQAEPAEPDDEQLAQIREAEEAMGRGEP